MDVLGGFFAEHCVVDPKAQVASAELYARYRDWAVAAGETSLSKAALAGPLIERGCRSKKVNHVRSWVGIRLRGPLDDGDADDAGTAGDAVSGKVPLGASRGEVFGNGVPTRPRPALASPDSCQESDMFDSEKETRG
jgi:hypothetical protein